MTTLVVEDGSALSNSNCYVSQADCITYANSRGLAAATGFLSLTSADQVTAILRGAQYLDAHYSGRWKAYRLLKTQAMAWPRVMSAPVYQFTMTPLALRSISYLLDADGFPVSSNEVPKVVINANCELAQAYGLGVDLTPGQTQPFVKMHRAGDTQVEYAAGYRADQSGQGRDASLATVDQMLEPFLISIPGSSFTNVRMIRG